MARLTYVEKETAKPEQEKVLSQLTQRSGKIANIWKLWSHSPLTLEPFAMFYKALMKGALDGKLRELAYIKTSILNDCAYCAEAHKGLARKLGVTEEQLQALNNYESSNLFTPLEKLALKYAEELTKTAKSSDGLVKVFESLIVFTFQIQVHPQVQIWLVILRLYLNCLPVF